MNVQKKIEKKNSWNREKQQNSLQCGIFYPKHIMITLNVNGLNSKHTNFKKNIVWLDLKSKTQPYALYKKPRSKDEEIPTIPYQQYSTDINQNKIEEAN